MVQQTAVEWLIKELEEQKLIKLDKLSTILFNKNFATRYELIIEQAKAMEKEHLEDCWIAAHQAGRFEGKGIAEEDWQTFFQYYNETYNK